MICKALARKVLVAARGGQNLEDKIDLARIARRKALSPNAPPSN